MHHHPAVTISLTLLLLALFHHQVGAGPRYSSRIVETASGAIRGVIVELNSRHLEPVEVFRGVPYAAPPVGPLRFRAPQPPLRWPGARLAESFGDVCPQRPPDLSNRTAALQSMPRARYNYLKKLVPLLANYSEDCLFLNIYIPGSGNRGVEAPYSVLFFIHGESFEWGSGNSYDGSVLASYGHVIVITVNYRLGLLGFLRTRPVASYTKTDARTTTMDDNVSNIALLDLVAALRWVRANIGAFGGDVSRVTIHGHGTGAALANLLLVLPSARGLFARAALFSGSALSPWATAPDPDAQRTQIATHLSCTDVEDDIAPCLRASSVEALLDAQSSVPEVRFMSRFAPTLPLHEARTSPAIAMERASDIFITSQLLLCVASTESYADFSASDIQYGFEEEQRNRVLRTYIRNAYVYHLNEIFSAVRNEYTDWDKPIQHPINIRDSTLEALSDGHTVAPLVRVAYLHARRGARTYLGHFGYQSKDSEFPQRLGTVRGEDLAYITGQPLVTPRTNFSRQDATVTESLLMHLTNFAKSGDPNTPITATMTQQQKQLLQQQAYTKHRPAQWDTYEIGTQLYLSITAKPKMKSHYRGHKIALWLNLIPQLHQPGDEDVSMRHHHFHERDPIYYAGAIRPESFTRLPPPLHPASMTESYMTSASESSSTECLTEPTTEETLQEISLVASEQEDDEMLQHLTTRQYYSYTAALGVTVGVGCLLLVLNMLIFAGIYYQRDKDRKRQQNQSGSNSPHSSESLAMTGRPQTNGGEYLTLTKTATILDATDVGKSSIINKPPPPKPPVRTSSNPASCNVKKRVQIQEISL